MEGPDGKTRCKGTMQRHNGRTCWKDIMEELDGTTRWTKPMETHGGGDVPQSHLQETCQNNLTKTFCTLSKSTGIPTWEIKNTTTDVETFRYVGGKVKEN